MNHINNETKTDVPVAEVVNKYENVSDNGSEISDEGYRSLGLIQNGNSHKRASMHSQASNEDAENSGEFNICISNHSFYFLTAVYTFYF